MNRASKEEASVSSNSASIICLETLNMEAVFLQSKELSHIHISTIHWNLFEILRSLMKYGDHVRDS